MLSGVIPHSLRAGSASVINEGDGGEHPAGIPVNPHSPSLSKRAVTDEMSAGGIVFSIDGGNNDGGGNIGKQDQISVCSTFEGTEIVVCL